MQAIVRLHHANGDTPYPDADLYDAAYDEALWSSYAAAIDQGPERSEVALRLHKVRDAILALDGKKLVNFGSGYGWLENEIATRSKIEAIGVDRRQAARNRAKFPAARFEDIDDVFAFLAKERPEIFSAVNILHIFTSGFIDRLFQALADSGCRHIVIWEPSGISAETGRVYRYTDTPKPSEVYYGQEGGAVIMHNYPAIFRKAGYSVTQQSHNRWPDPRRKGHAPVMFVANRHSLSR